MTNASDNDWIKHVIMWIVVNDKYNNNMNKCTNNMNNHVMIAWLIDIIWIWAGMSSNQIINKFR